MKILHNVKIVIKMTVLSLLIDFIGLYGIFGKNMWVEVVTFVLTFIYTIILLVDIVGTIKVAVSCGEKMASGDFTTGMTRGLLTRKDELGGLARSMDHIACHTRELIGNIQGEVDNLGDVVVNTEQSFKLRCV